MLCFAFKVRHGRIAVRRNDDDGVVIVSFQPYVRKKPGKATDIVVRELGIYPGAPWWMRKTVEYNARLKKCPNGRFGSFVAV